MRPIVFLTIPTAPNVRRKGGLSVKRETIDIKPQTSLVKLCAPVSLWFRGLLHRCNVPLQMKRPACGLQ
jgi:hypothetical protein